MQTYRGSKRVAVRAERGVEVDEPDLAKMSVVKASRLLAVPCAPPKTKSLSLQLLVANAFIQQSAAGMFSLLPLGQRVISRLTAVIERELDGIGAQKVSMPFLGAKELWERTGSQSQPTAEEMVTDLVGSHSRPSKAAYPLLIYQTTDKFRDEMNPRFGLLRGRSFLMNDLYSFDLREEGARETYSSVSDAYDRILRERLGLEVYKVRADSGVHGGTLSHEYHMKNGLEEDAMEVCTSCDTYYKADEPSEECCEGARRRRVSSIEVAHTFILGTRYAEALNAWHGTTSEKLPLHMCCFGIGVTRLVAALIEARTTVKEPRIHLPTAIQPFDAVVIPSKSLASSPLVGEMADALLEQLATRENPNPSVLIDDRLDLSIGRRVQAAQAIGQSRVVVLGKETEKTRDTTPLYELWTAAPERSEKLQQRGTFDLPQTVQRLAASV
ncbi:pars-2 [Pristionchus pacificus]|uniref:Pars-2 n=1 Tax=Pristionchus pacificus TaxID=54126 RepID=A0A2A6BSI9_PRIPA|nr:pars-2 [Pristionchus pacificus]|eukprot:PDM68848.1 pars-2 [Pristionchus pacificus]